MPDDDPPLNTSTTVTETVTTDTGADKETADSLDADFKDFWKEEDNKQDGAPEAPGDGAAQETRRRKRRNLRRKRPGLRRRRLNLRRKSIRMTRSTSWP